MLPGQAAGGCVDGERCYRSLADLPEPVGGVLVVVPLEQGMDVVHQAAAAGITGSGCSKALNRRGWNTAAPGWVLKRSPVRAS